MLDQLEDLFELLNTCNLPAAEARTMQRRHGSVGDDKAARSR
jgi:hypothetical protein